MGSNPLAWANVSEIQDQFGDDIFKVGEIGKALHEADGDMNKAVDILYDWSENKNIRPSKEEIAEFERTVLAIKAESEAVSSAEQPQSAAEAASSSASSSASFGPSAPSGSKYSTTKMEVEYSSKMSDQPPVPSFSDGIPANLMKLNNGPDDDIYDEATFEEKKDILFSVLGETASEELIETCLNECSGHLAEALKLYHNVELAQFCGHFANDSDITLPFQHSADEENLMAEDIMRSMPGKLAFEVEHEYAALASRKRAIAASRRPLPAIPASAPLPAPSSNPKNSAKKSKASAKSPPPLPKNATLHFFFPTRKDKSPAEIKTVQKTPASGFSSAAVIPSLKKDSAPSTPSATPPASSVISTPSPLKADPAPLPPLERLPIFGRQEIVTSFDKPSGTPPPKPRAASASSSSDEEIMDIEKSSREAAAATAAAAAAALMPPPPSVAAPLAAPIIFYQVNIERDEDNFPKVLGEGIKMELTPATGATASTASLRDFSDSQKRKLVLVRVPGFGNEISLQDPQSMGHPIVRIVSNMTVDIAPLIDAGLIELSFKIIATKDKSDDASGSSASSSIQFGVHRSSDGRESRTLTDYKLSVSLWAKKDFFSEDPSSEFMDLEFGASRPKGLTPEQEAERSREKRIRLAKIHTMRFMFPELDTSAYKVKSSSEINIDARAKKSEVTPLAPAPSSSAAASSADAIDIDGMEAEDLKQEVGEHDEESEHTKALRSELEKQVVTALGHEGELQDMPTIERPPGLRPEIQLRYYQKQGLWFLLRREAQNKTAFQRSYIAYKQQVDEFVKHQEIVQKYEAQQKEKQPEKKEQRSTGKRKYELTVDDLDSEGERDGNGQASKDDVEIIIDSDDSDEEERPAQRQRVSERGDAQPMSAIAREKAPASSSSSSAPSDMTVEADGQDEVITEEKYQLSKRELNSRLTRPEVLLKNLIADCDAEDGEASQYSQELEDESERELQNPQGSADDEDEGRLQDDAVPVSESRSKIKMHPLFVKLRTPRNEFIYFQPFTGQAVFTMPRAPAEAAGGILADEMGLGKTLQIIALHLAHPPRNGSHAPTLIVCPKVVCDVWVQEFQKFCSTRSAPRVIVWHGLGKKAVQKAADLKNVDVLITTYQTLAIEFKKCFEVTKDKKDKEKLWKPQSKWPFFFQSPASGPLFHRIVLDEAHNIKNRDSLSAQACCAVKARFRWSVTGTVIQNSLDDLFSQLKFLQAKPFDDYELFNRLIASPFSKAKDEAAGARLRSLMKPIFLQRLKDSLYNGKPLIVLPKKHEAIVELKMSQQERDFYSILEAQSKNKVAAFLENSALGMGSQNFSQILVLLLRLRQTCDHAALVLPALKKIKESPVDMMVDDEDDSKSQKKKKKPAVQMFDEDVRKKLQKMLLGFSKSAASMPVDSEFPPVEEKQAEELLCPSCNCDAGQFGGKVLLSGCHHVYCKQCAEGMLNEEGNGRCCMEDCDREFDRSSIADVRGEQQVDEEKDEKENGEGERAEESAEILAEQERELLQARANTWIPSSKMESLIKGLHDVIHQGEKAIIFSHFTAFLDLVGTALMDHGIVFARLDGSMSMTGRRDQIKKFREKPQCSVFLLSTKAGGVGLTLVEANHCWILDPWWNPAVESQALSRCHRIGQTKEVFVHRFIMENSVETRLLEIQRKKLEIANSATARGNKEELKKLSIKDIKHLFGL